MYKKASPAEAPHGFNEWRLNWQFRFPFNDHQRDGKRHRAAADASKHQGRTAGEGGEKSRLLFSTALTCIVDLEMTARLSPSLSVLSVLFRTLSTHFIPSLPSQARPTYWKSIPQMPGKSVS